MSNTAYITAISCVSESGDHYLKMYEGHLTKDEALTLLEASTGECRDYLYEVQVRIKGIYDV